MLSFSVLKTNYAKFEIDGIGVKKGVKMALCGIECIDLMDKRVKILGFSFSDNKNRTRAKFLKSDC